MQPISNWLLLLAVVVVAIAGGGLTWWLLSIAATSGPDASIRIEAIRTGLSAGVGTGGAFALLLAFRRQRSTEISALHTITDATERRVTELYTKAADQLGSDKAPVRLAGLYALERLAKDSPGQRPTIVNVICAYLQMPYTPAGTVPVEPSDVASPATSDTATPEVGSRKGQSYERYEKRIQEHEKRAQEHRVRATAQRILLRHLSKTQVDDLRWQTTVDLSGAFLAQANLREADLTKANLGEADLTKANLRVANLIKANLGRADLTKADLREADLTEADLRWANLTEANLSKADLTGVVLNEANLSNANLDEATLCGVDLTEATNLTEAQLRMTNLIGARLSKTDTGLPARESSDGPN